MRSYLYKRNLSRKTIEQEETKGAEKDWRIVYEAT